MKIKYFRLITVIILNLFLQSCVKNEALNAEADIISAELPSSTSLNIESIVINNTSVTFNIKDFQGELTFAPNFLLTAGATITPKVGTILNFSEPQIYTVISQDRQWTKTYTVSVVNDNSSNNSTYKLHSFETADIITTEAPLGSYNVFYDQLVSGQKKYIWANANEGFNVLASTLAAPGEVPVPQFYPTSQINEGKQGKGVLLQTKSTGPLGGLFGSPLATGSLFLGNFQLTVPSINSTHFGIPFQGSEIPKSVKGYFKYKAGSTFLVNNAPSSLSKDTWDAYALIFEARNENNFLTGTHQFSDERIIAMARITQQQRTETNQWTPFELIFNMVPSKSYDPSKEYMITIVFASSLEGDKFNGAVGSQLWIDEVQVIKE